MKINLFGKIKGALSPKRRKSASSLPNREPTPLEKRIGYYFRSAEIMNHALAHRSHAVSESDNLLLSNERLEFLGDALLGFVAADYLYHRYNKKLEGELSRIKSVIISRKALKTAADKITLSDSLLLSKAEEKTGGRTRFSINSNAFEALIAAIYLDGGFAPAKLFIERFVLVHLDELLAADEMMNFKSILLEKVQAKGDDTPKYVVKRESGPDHDKNFEIAVVFGFRERGFGTGKTKKEAEQLAAKDALQNSKNFEE
ncbi:MAG: ribonuclease III [Fibrobacteres bacterium]|nr:ribonuclease III [Fibrobacterota bacterium]